MAEVRQKLQIAAPRKVIRSRENIVMPSWEPMSIDAIGLSNAKVFQTGAFGVVPNVNASVFETAIEHNPLESFYNNPKTANSFRYTDANYNRFCIAPIGGTSNIPSTTQVMQSEFNTTAKKFQEMVQARENEIAQLKIAHQQQEDLIRHYKLISTLTTRGLHGDLNAIEELKKLTFDKNALPPDILQMVNTLEAQLSSTTTNQTAQNRNTQRQQDNSSDTASLVALSDLSDYVADQTSYVTVKVQFSFMNGNKSAYLDTKVLPTNTFLQIFDLVQQQYPDINGLSRNQFEMIVYDTQSKNRFTDQLWDKSLSESHFEPEKHVLYYNQILVGAGEKNEEIFSDDDMHPVVATLIEILLFDNYKFLKAHITLGKLSRNDTAIALHALTNIYIMSGDLILPSSKTMMPKGLRNITINETKSDPVDNASILNAIANLTDMVTQVKNTVDEMKREEKPEFKIEFHGDSKKIYESSVMKQPISAENIDKETEDTGIDENLHKQLALYTKQATSF